MVWMQGVVGLEWAVEGVPSFRRRKQDQSLAEMEAMAEGGVSLGEREDTFIEENMKEW